MFADRETALALPEDQTGWMLLSRVERGSCTIHHCIDTPELTWKLKTKSQAIKYYAETNTKLSLGCYWGKTHNKTNEQGKIQKHQEKCPYSYVRL